METRRLLYFLRIAEAGSINRAAENLDVAQSALSQQLAILEAEVKTKLLVRSRLGVTLTDAGKLFYGRAQVILRQIEDLENALTDGREVAGFVTVGLPPSLSVRVGSQLVQQVLARHPAIRLHMVEASGTRLIEQFRAGMSDIAVVPALLAGSDVEAALLCREEMVIVASKAFQQPADAAGLLQLPWVLPHPPNYIRSMAAGLFTWAEQDLQPVAEVDSLALLIDLIAAGVGVSLLPRGTAEAAGPDFALWPIVPTPLYRPMQLCVRTDRTTSAAVMIVRDLLLSLGK